MLNGMAFYTKKYCRRVRHTLSTASYFMVDPDYQLSLIHLQGLCMNELTNTMFILENNIDKMIEHGFGFQITHLQLYRSVARLLNKIYLVSNSQNAGWLLRY